MQNCNNFPYFVGALCTASEFSIGVLKKSFLYVINNQTAYGK